MAQDEEPQDRPASSPSADELALLRRVSDLEREQVAEVLREAAGEGRLTFVELEERLEAVYAAKTYGELAEPTADLPNGLAVPSARREDAPVVRQTGEPARTGPAINVFLSDSKRTGNWLAPQRQEVNAFLGDVTLDYTQAQVPYDEVHVDVRSILADVKIRVPRNAVVHLDGNPILGSVTEQDGSGADDGDAAGPPKVFHIRGTAVLGEIKVKRGPRRRRYFGLH